MRCPLRATVAAILYAAGLPAWAQSVPQTLPEMVITAPSAATVTEQPTGQTRSTIDRERFQDSPAASIGQVLQYSPGVTIKQGNGPRDVGISIRGSNARNGFGIRNIQVFEDGFPLTQPDGLSRTDLTDPHAYGAIDVYRGPSSALFGNYATGGAVNFVSRRDLRGFEVGADGGSFGYANSYVALGGRNGAFDYTLFGSMVRSAGFTANSGFITGTENILASYAPSADDLITVKLINNDLDTRLPIRLSLNQFRQNPFQSGCTSAAGAAPGCGTVTLFANGVAGATTAQTAEQAGLGRTDRRTIVGTRWEHALDKDTTWRSQLVFDNRDVNQPTGASSGRGVFPSINVSSDLTQQARLAGFDATHFLGVFFNYEDFDSDTFNLAPGGKATLGALTANASGHHYNLGSRAREELRFSPQWTGILGLGVEYSEIDAVNTTFGATGTSTPALRRFGNVAPEAALLYRPDPAWQFRTRVATGYGTPQSGNLFVTPAGVTGNNTQLESQSNLGVDVGIDWTPDKTLSLGITGFYEFFENELVTQSPGAGLLSYTFNAPASEHRGIEASALWRPRPGWALRLSYLLDDQIYTRYVETLSAGVRSASFNRAGNKIPGVEPHLLVARLGYDQPDGPFAGLGGFIEYSWRDAFFIDNANLAKAPGVQLVNLNLHYNPGLEGSLLKGVRLFFEVQNLLDRTYIASANNVSDSISAVTGAQNPAATVAAAGGSIYAGAPRSVFAGVKLSF